MNLVVVGGGRLRISRARGNYAAGLAVLAARGRVFLHCFFLPFLLRARARAAVLLFDLP